MRRFPIEFGSEWTHALMLRNLEKYRRIARALSPHVRGAEVLDVGTGTGVLAVLAARLGAHRVWAVEQPEVAALAEQVIAGFPDERARITLIKESFFEVRPRSTSCDVLLSETVGYLGLEENAAALLSRALRWGRPGAVLIPDRIGVGFRALDRAARSKVRPYLEVATAPDVLAERAFSTPLLWELGGQPQRATAAVVWRASEATRIAAIRVVSVARVGVEFIGSAVMPQWPTCVVPLSRVLDVRASDQVSIEFSIEPCNDAYFSRLAVRAGREVCHAEFLSSGVAILPDLVEQVDDNGEALADKVARVIESAAGAGARGYETDNEQ